MADDEKKEKEEKKERTFADLKDPILIYSGGGQYWIERSELYDPFPDKPEKKDK
jgi:hypothetical protein